MDKLYTQHWIELPKDIRAHLKKVFSISSTGLTEVRDQTLISDGTTNEDLARAFTKESMTRYVGSDGTFPHLWTCTVSKANFEINPPMAIRDNPQVPELDLSTMVPVPADILKEIQEIPVIKWCDFCDSKGVRHSKTCTKPGVVDGFEVKHVE